MKQSSEHEKKMHGEELYHLTEYLTGHKHTPSDDASKPLRSSFSDLQKKFGSSRVEELVESGLSGKQLLEKLKEPVEMKQRPKFQPKRKPTGIEVHYPLKDSDEGLKAGTIEEILPELDEKQKQKKALQTQFDQLKLKKKKPKPVLEVKKEFNITSKAIQLFSDFMNHTNIDEYFNFVWKGQYQTHLEIFLGFLALVLAYLIALQR